MDLRVTIEPDIRLGGFVWQVHGDQGVFHHAHAATYEMARIDADRYVDRLQKLIGDALERVKHDYPA